MLISLGEYAVLDPCLGAAGREWRASKDGKERRGAREGPAERIWLGGGIVAARPGIWLPGSQASRGGICFDAAKTLRETAVWPMIWRAEEGLHGGGRMPETALPSIC